MIRIAIFICWKINSIALSTSNLFIVKLVKLKSWIIGGLLLLIYLY